MKHILTLLALLLAPLAAHAQQTAPDSVRDRLWLFGVPADGPRLFYEGAGYRGGSRMTPAEGAFWLGVPNLMFITQPWNQPPAMSREKAWKTMTTELVKPTSTATKPATTALSDRSLSIAGG
jgi:hypothetical protein